MTTPSKTNKLHHRDLAIFQILISSASDNSYMYLLTFAVRIKRQKVRTAGILIIENSSLYVSVMPFVSSFVGISSLFSFFKKATSVVVIKKTAPQKNRKSGGGKKW